MNSARPDALRVEASAVRNLDLTVRVNPDNGSVSASIALQVDPGTATVLQDFTNPVAPVVEFRGGESIHHHPVDGDVPKRVISHDSSSPLSEGAATPCDDSVEREASAAPSAPSPDGAAREAGGTDA